MSKDSGPVIDQRLVRAVAHRDRIAILEALIDAEVLSLGEIANKLGIKPASVNYHVDVLIASGAIEAVQADPHPAAERTFRLSPLSMIGNQRWRELSTAARDCIATALLEGFVGRAASFLPPHGSRGA
jgi:predicted ArsR family transcriptional regulator